MRDERLRDRDREFMAKDALNVRMETER